MSKQTDQAQFELQSKVAWDKLARVYDAAMPTLAPHVAMRRAIKEWLKKESTSVLSVGGGSGLLEAEYQAEGNELPPWTISDLSSEMLIRFLERNPESETTLVRMDTLDYLKTLPDNSVDRLLASNSLIADPGKLPEIFSEIHRVMKPGAKFFISIVHKFTPAELLRAQLNLKAGTNLLLAIKTILNLWSMRHILRFAYWAKKVEKLKENEIFLSQDEWREYIQDGGLVVDSAYHYSGGEVYEKSGGQPMGSIFIGRKPAE